MSNRRTIDVRKQRDLTFRETVGLCLRGVSERMLRSVLTLSVVSLAVAFFMFLLSENQLISAVAERTRGEVRHRRLAARVLSRAYHVPTRVAQAQRLAAMWRLRKDDVDEAAAVCGWATDRTAALARRTAEEASYLAFFESIAPGKRAALVQKLKGRRILRALVDEDAREKFTAALVPMHDVRLPGGMDSFSGFLDDYASYASELDAFTGAWSETLARLETASAALTGGEPVVVWLASCDETSLLAWGAALRSFGFLIRDSDLPLIQQQLHAAELRRAIARVLQRSEKREAWRKVFRERKRIAIGEKILKLGDDRAAGILDGAYSAAVLQQTARDAARANRLDRFEKKLMGVVAQDAEAGTLSGRQMFLLMISFVVCMVGITNAMLMSITERFREIATMKCLGATDRFILFQFMTEAGLQGLSGGVAGMLIGFAAAGLKNVLGFGGYVFGAWPATALLVGAAMSLGAGVILSVLSSVYPAWTASRMAPMEAMRVE